MPSHAATAVLRVKQRATGRDSHYTTSCIACSTPMKRSNVVYFIGDGNFVKIGFTSNDAVQRLAQLQTGNPKPLALYGWIKGDRNLEKRLHEHFRVYREEGEWFRLSAEIRAFIDFRCLHGY